MFQIKTADSITASIINNVKAMTDELTDFNIGSKNRTLIEATAREIEQFYQQLLKGFYEAVPVAIYKSFSFGRLSASCASGYVTFTKTAAAMDNTIVVPEGSSLRIPNTENYYTLAASVTINSGVASSEGFVTAIIPGTSGNAASNSITQLVNEIEGIESLTNRNAFTNASDDETDSERKVRFQKYVKSLARATTDSLSYGAKSSTIRDANGLVTERVTNALTHEQYHDVDGEPGYVDVYIWNGVSGASASLINETKKVLEGYYDSDGNRVPGWKGAGILLNVYAVTADPVNITADITCENGYSLADIESNITDAIDQYFSSLDIANTMVRAKLIDIIMGVTGVYDVSVTAPAGNITPEWNHIKTRGALTLNEV